MNGLTATVAGSALAAAPELWALTSTINLHVFPSTWKEIGQPLYLAKMSAIIKLTSTVYPASRILTRSSSKQSSSIYSCCSLLNIFLLLMISTVIRCPPSIDSEAALTVTSHLIDPAMIVPNRLRTTCRNMV